jgi:hypothetical protein
MKIGKTINELAAYLTDIQNNARDFVVPTQRLRVTLDDIVTETETRKAQPVLSFENGDEHRFTPNSWSHRQLATYADIPQQYYDRIRQENPELFVDMANHGLRRQVEAAAPGKTESRMVRTYRGQVRALVSDRYRRLDSIDLLEAVAPIIVDSGMQVLSSEVTDQRMYLQLATPKLQGEVKKGDVVQHGLVISSSDVGAGSVRVEPMIYRLVCTNGMISSAAIKKFHLGRAQGEDDVYELLTDDTMKLTDQAFWAQVSDVVKASLMPKRFEAELDKLRVAANEPIRNFDLPRVVELAAKHVGVAGEKVRQFVVAYLANGADGAGLTRWGLANAFTAVANTDLVGYDEAVELERVGAKIIDLSASVWKNIAATPAA